MKQLLLIAGVVLAASWSRAAVAEPLQIRMATLAPSGSPWVDFMERAASEITTATEGRVTFKYFPGGQQGDERDFVRKIKLGQLDGAAVTAAGLAMIEPSILVLGLPMLFTSEDEVDYVATKMWPYFQKKFEQKGFRLAERGELGWIYLFSKNKVASISDLQKQKLWTLGDEQFGSTIVDKLKLNGVPLGIAEVDAALTSGRINACFSSPLGAISLQWYTKVKYMSTPPIAFAIGATLLSLDAAKKVSPDDAKVIEEIARHNQKKARAVIRKANEDARKMILRKGITVVPVPQAMIDELAAVATEVQAELVGKMYSKEELAKVIAYRDEYRAKHAKPAAK
ncbi:MAG: TRAP transporter substrate-binding protein DctP [Myxococcales bacterium]|nr:TRAP transporter substrate-binding protein DctP [Myxococcales bacterium]